ncbi:Lrp/AsnC family transcriptional regulator [Rhizobium sp. YJ-22]|uniref:Lrp/AsnC family transcriptional regulator n=1 Tax=Rhizobium sp. YJ-22 TaxID=3037556 RepID=UPI0024126DFE|nr:Lrp/AsnC family transcriptional regulator [Rhizobium sp. YJ-22]MDG3576721.1 Lrp/AsnC family transcriptional regulator [Rhizobium sp. YJ-22]
MKDLDAKDRLLLAALRADARRSLVELARHAGLSRSAVHERIRRLEDAKVIAGYTVRLSGDIARHEVEALIAVSLQQGRNCDHVVPYLTGIPQVVTCWSVAGPTDLMLLVACATNGELDTVRRQIASTPGIATVQTNVSLRMHFDRRA